MCWCVTTHSVLVCNYPFCVGMYLSILCYCVNHPPKRWTSSSVVIVRICSLLTFVFVNVLSQSYWWERIVGAEQEGEGGEVGVDQRLLNTSCLLFHKRTPSNTAVYGIHFFKGYFSKEKSFIVLSGGQKAVSLHLSLLPTVSLFPYAVLGRSMFCDQNWFLK